jgi:hypothetical protein
MKEPLRLRTLFALGLILFAMFAVAIRSVENDSQMTILLLLWIGVDVVLSLQSRRSWRHYFAEQRTPHRGEE